MTSPQDKDNSIILRDVHCPYCDKNHALLMSRKTSTTFGIRFPAYGLRFIFSLIYLSFLHTWRYGYKWIEFTKGRDYATYGFCPSCGNSYSAGAPEDIMAEANEPKFYRVRKGKAITGYCQGIAEYTDIPVLWIRIMTVLFGATLLGTFVYFLIAVCIPFREDVESGAIADKRFYKARKGEGKVFMGICKGISEYTEISVAWIRVLMVCLALTILPAIAYFIVGANTKTKEQADEKR